MTNFNELFVCSQCGHSIAPEMDRLDILHRKLKVIVEEMDFIRKQLTSLPLNKRKVR